MPKILKLDNSGFDSVDRHEGGEKVLAIRPSTEMQLAFLRSVFFQAGVWTGEEGVECLKCRCVKCLEHKVGALTSNLILTYVNVGFKAHPMTTLFENVSI